MSTLPDPNQSEQPVRKQKDDAPLYTDALMDVLGFNRNALEANRDGHLTGSQRSAMKADLQDDVDGLNLLMSISFGVILLLTVIMLINGMGLTELVIGSSLFLVPLMAFAFFRQRNKRDDREQSRISSTEGASRVYMTSPGGIGHAYLEVNGKRFPISYEQAHALSQFNLPPIRVYHSENNRFILSAEVMHDDRKRKRKNDATSALEDNFDEADFDIDIDESRTASGRLENKRG